MLAYFLPSEDEYDEKCVSVMLEGEETEMVFIDHPHSEISVNGRDHFYEFPQEKNLQIPALFVNA